jgi:hypothetical protein
VDGSLAQFADRGKESDMHRFAFVIVILVLGCAGSTAPALAAPPEKTHFSFDAMDSSFDSVGITVPESLPQKQNKEEST